MAKLELYHIDNKINLFVSILNLKLKKYTFKDSQDFY